MSEKLTCQICDKRFKHLGSHVVQGHHILARDYKIKFGLDISHPLVISSISEKHRQDAYKYKMDKRLKRAGMRTRFKEGFNSERFYKRSAETIDRLNRQRVSEMWQGSWNGKKKTAWRKALSLSHKKALSEGRWKLTPEGLERMKESKRKLWANPTWRDKQIKIFKKYQENKKCLNSK